MHNTLHVSGASLPLSAPFSALTAKESSQRKISLRFWEAK